MIERFIYRVRALPCNVVVTCHESYDKDEVRGNIKGAPDITGKLSSRIPNLFDLVFHAETVFLKEDNTEIKLRVKSTPTFPAGPRLNIKEAFIEPSYEAMMKAIESGRTVK